jgi:predicted ABC-type ATPase
LHLSLVNEPILTVVAGCNGSGKSSFSAALTPDDSLAFDYDKEYLNIYQNEFDSDIRQIVAHNKTRQLLEERVEESIFTRSHFAYETNFNSTPLFWPDKFKEANLFLSQLNRRDKKKSANQS